MRSKVNGVELYFDVQGPERVVQEDAVVERRTVVAIPGGPGFDQAYLEPGLGPLEKLCQVVYLDLRGTGLSETAPLETCTLEQNADDVVALCAKLGIRRPILFGHSAGGNVALTVAHRHPKTLGGLILCATVPAFGHRYGDRSPRLADRAPPEVLAVAEKLWRGDASPKAFADYVEQVGPYYAADECGGASKVMGLSRMSLELMNWFFTNEAQRYDARPWLSSIDLPTLVLTGRHDWVCTPAASRVIAEGIAGAELVEFEHSAHLVFSEEPERFQVVVARFMERL